MTPGIYMRRFALTVAAVGMLTMQSSLSADKGLGTTQLSSLDDHLTADVLAGVWEEVAPAEVDCQTRAPLGPVIRALLTFHQGGTMYVEDTYPAPFPIRSTGGGTWNQTSGRRYSYGNMHYEFDANKIFGLIIRQRSSLTVSRDGNSFTEMGTFEGLDTSGTDVLFNGCFEATAKRVVF